jgi:hypothetical protein
MYWAINPLIALAIPEYVPGGQVRDVSVSVIAGLIRHTLTTIVANAMKRGTLPKFSPGTDQMVTVKQLVDQIINEMENASDHIVCNDDDATHLR